jgi:hypothetical protein
LDKLCDATDITLCIFYMRHSYVPVWQSCLQSHFRSHSASTLSYLTIHSTNTFHWYDGSAKCFSTC